MVKEAWVGLNLGRNGKACGAFHQDDPSRKIGPTLTFSQTYSNLLKPWQAASDGGDDGHLALPIAAYGRCET
jgi:hypothetical protein